MKYILTSILFPLFPVEDYFWVVKNNLLSYLQMKLRSKDEK